VTLLGLSTMGCSESLESTGEDGTSDRAVGRSEQGDARPSFAAGAKARASASLEADPRRAPPAVLQAQRRSPVTATARGVVEVRRREFSPRVGEAARIESIEERIAGLTPEEAIALLEQSMGPLDGAHYVLQSGSEIRFVDGDRLPLDGEFSLIDCRDPEIAAREPDRDFRYWIGGLRLTSPPEVLVPARAGTVHLPQLGESGYSERMGWGSMHIRGTRVTRFERKLDLRIAEQELDWALELHRWMYLDADSSSEGRFDGDDSACPDELSLHLLVEERTLEWERVDGWDGSTLQPIRGSNSRRLLARVDLELLHVSYEAEIFDPGQRAPRYEAASRGVVVGSSSREPARAHKVERRPPARVESEGVLDLR
jgi:hypothetical protein